MQNMDDDPPMMRQEYQEYLTEMEKRYGSK